MGGVAELLVLHALLHCECVVAIHSCSPRKGLPPRQISAHSYPVGNPGPTRHRNSRQRSNLPRRTKEPGDFFQLHKTGVTRPRYRILSPAMSEPALKFAENSARRPCGREPLRPGFGRGGCLGDDLRAVATTRSAVCGATVSSSSVVVRARREGIQDAVPGTGGPRCPVDGKRTRPRRLSSGKT